MAIDVTNDKEYYDEDGNIRRRDNIAAVLTEGDILIEADGSHYEVVDGDITIYTSGKRTGDGTLTFLPSSNRWREYLHGRQMFDINELGLN